jgi:hypothetical protein
MTGLPIALVAAFSLALIVTGVAAPVASGRCSTTGTIFKASSDTAFTGSTTFVAVPESNVTFTSGRRSCVIVQFSSEVETNGNTVFLQATIGATVCEPGKTGNTGIQLQRDSGSFVQSEAVNFVCEDVPAGRHTMRLRYRVSQATADVFLYHRSVILHYTK